jgi:hypothetical protein
MSFSQSRKDASDLYLPDAMRIISSIYHSSVEIAPQDLDMSDGVDLMLPNGTRLALRVRSPHQKAKHYSEVIFRMSTEWPKLLAGITPRYYLYCFAKNESEIDCWWLLDIEAIRAAYRDRWRCTIQPIEEPSFGDGIVVVRLDGFLSHPRFVLATSEPERPKTQDRICSECLQLAWQNSINEILS